MKTISLYNNDGTLSIEAEFYISVNPPNVPRTEWLKMLKEFKLALSSADLKEFERLKENDRAKRWRKNNPDKAKGTNALHYDKDKASEWRKNNPDKIKEYSKKRYWNNRERLLSISKKWSKDNPEKSKKNHQKWATDNPIAAAESRTKTRRKHREKRNNYSAEWQKNKREADPIYRVFQSLRARCNQIVKALSLCKKDSSTLKHVGCSPEELKVHIESLFLEGMTWDNYGKYGWHVDHIRPVCSFSAEEWQLANHYTNLRPLWAVDNIKKSVTDKQQSRYKTV
jgi:hypothetical protein